MKKLILAVFLFISACGTSQATASPNVIVNQYPTLLPTPTLAVQSRTIEGAEKEEALNYFYELKMRMAAGDSDHFAEEIRYPITAHVDGQPKTFVYAAEVDENFGKIFSQDAIQKFISTDESQLTFTPDGVKVADGLIWFNLICLDPACENAEFMITKINN